MLTKSLLTKNIGFFLSVTRCLSGIGNINMLYELLKKELEETKQECSRFRKVVAELKKENSLLSIELQEYKERNKTIIHRLWYFILSLFGNNHQPQISRNYEANTY